MKYVLRFFGFGGMIVGVSGMAEQQRVPLALLIIIVSALLLGLDSFLEDRALEKKNRNRCIGIDASRVSYLR